MHSETHLRTKFLCHELAFVLQAVYAPALRNRIRGLRIKADSASAFEQRSSQASYIARGGFDPQWKPASRLVLTHLQWQIKAAIQGTALLGRSGCSRRSCKIYYSTNEFSGASFATILTRANESYRLASSFKRGRSLVIN